jgi:transposase
VRLIPAQYVKPCVQTNKSDFLDAEAIAGAVHRPRMHFVQIKAEKQLDLQALRRVRKPWRPLIYFTVQLVASIDIQVPTILAQPQF